MPKPAGGTWTAGSDLAQLFLFKPAPLSLFLGMDSGCPSLPATILFKKNGIDYEESVPSQRKNPHPEPCSACPSRIAVHAEL